MLPMTADELARTAAECLDEGASMIHLHVRDADGAHVLDAEAYRTATARILDAVGDRLVVQITSEWMGRYPPAEQMAVVLDTNPEAVSLALRELAPEKKDEPLFSDFLNRLKQMRVWPQIILYTADEAARLAAMQAEGFIPFERLAVLYVLGRYSLLRTAAPSDLLPFLAPGMPRFESLERLRLRPSRGGLRRCGRAARRPCARRLREQSRAARRRALRPPTPNSSASSRARSPGSGSRCKARMACARRSPR